MNLLLFGVKIMKIKAKYFSIGVVVFSLFSCTNGTEETVDYKNYDSSKYFRSSTPEFYSYDGIRNSTSSFEFEKAMIPINSSDFMYDEPVIFIGKDDEATLLYEPTEIHSVWDYAKTREFHEGVDFVIEGNKMRLTENSSMKFWDKRDYYNKDLTDLLHLIKQDGTFMRYAEGLALQYEFVVSYSHNSRNSYSTTSCQETKLKNTIEKIRKGQSVNIAFLGDSITVGMGSYNINESYVELVKKFFENNYKSNFNFENISYGGKSSSAAIKFACLMNFTPDLVFIAFGMNDIFSSALEYKSNIENCITTIHSKYPHSEIILVSSMLPNPDIYLVENNGKLDSVSATYSLEKSLIELEEKYSFVSLTPVTSISAELLSVKRDCSILSNNYNHPNNFLHRIYAQEILNTLFDDYYSVVK